jgi:uncharacterized protein YhjY with autotransporter beta-barrel domain
MVALARVLAREHVVSEGLRAAAGIREEIHSDPNYSAQQLQAQQLQTPSAAADAGWWLGSEQQAASERALHSAVSALHDGAVVMSLLALPSLLYVEC